MPRSAPGYSMVRTARRIKRYIRTAQRARKWCFLRPERCFSPLPRILSRAHSPRGGSAGKPRSSPRCLGSLWAPGQYSRAQAPAAAPAAAQARPLPARRPRSLAQAQPQGSDKTPSPTAKRSRQRGAEAVRAEPPALREEEARSSQGRQRSAGSRGSVRGALGWAGWAGAGLRAAGVCWAPPGQASGCEMGK